MTGGRSTSRAVLWATVGNLASPLAAFAVSPILAHSLGVSGRGEVAAGTALLLLFTAVGSLGLIESATYHVAARIIAAGRLIRSVGIYLVASGFALTALAWAIAPALSGGSAEVTSLIRLASWAITPSLCLGLLRGIAQGRQRWGVVNAEKYVTAIARVAPIAFLAMIGQLSTDSAVLTVAWSPVVGGVAYIALLRDARYEVDRSQQPKVLRFGMQVWVGSLSGVVLSRVDQTLMAPLGGVYELGLYAVAVNVAELLLIAQAAMGTVLFASDASENKDHRVYLGSRLSLTSALVLGCVIAAATPIWMPLLFGAEFMPAWPALLLLLAGAVVGAPGSVAGAALGARGYPGARSIALFAAAALNIVMLIALTPTFGAAGAAMATFGGNLLAGTICLAVAKVKLRLSLVELCVPRATDFRDLWRSLRSAR